MRKYCVIFDSENYAAIVCIKHLIENTFGKNVKIKEIKEKQKQKFDVLPSLDFVVYHEEVPRPFAINYNNHNITLSKDDFVKYCVLILKKFNTNDICEQYNILKRCGITDENLFLLFNKMSVSDVESIMNGNPYPYVVQQWGRYFSRITMDAKEEIENKNIVEEFNKAEAEDLKKNNKTISENEKHKCIDTFNKFVNYLDDNRISNDCFYKTYGISHYIIRNIRNGILPSKNVVRKLNEVFGSNIDPDNEEIIVVKKKEKEKTILDIKNTIYINNNSNPIVQLLENGFKQHELEKIFYMDKSYISKNKNNKNFKFRRDTKNHIEEISNGKIKFID